MNKPIQIKEVRFKESMVLGHSATAVNHLRVGYNSFDRAEFTMDFDLDDRFLRVRSARSDRDVLTYLVPLSSISHIDIIE